MSNEVGPVTRYERAEHSLWIAAGRIAEIEQSLDACRRNREIAEVAVEGLTAELAEARGEVAALELGNEDLQDELKAGR